MTTSVRRARPADVPAVTALLVDALSRDPVAEWLVPDADNRADVLHRLLDPLIHSQANTQACRLEPEEPGQGWAIIFPAPLPRRGRRLHRVTSTRRTNQQAPIPQGTGVESPIHWRGNSTTFVGTVRVWYGIALGAQPCSW